MKGSAVTKKSQNSGKSPTNKIEPISSAGRKSIKNIKGQSNDLEVDINRPPSDFGRKKLNKKSKKKKNKININNKKS